ncbi:hypothetical protein Dcar01_03180 [Deinococcus carri]|uniref:Uncharacterized protein n=1 Tax=Deinococcus carri TaxID=1211323 RepID=A0ABP9WAQ9_9DEIO
MSGPSRIGDLELSQDLDFHRREIRGEKIGWAVMLLVVLAALLGLFGSGPLSTGEARTPDGRLEAEYNRFARYMAPAELRLTFRPEAVREGQVQVWLSRDYLQHMVIQKVIPEPDSVQLDGPRLIYTFNVRQGTQSGDLVFELETEAIGRLNGSLGLMEPTGAAQGAGFSTFIYP